MSDWERTRSPLASHWHRKLDPESSSAAAPYELAGGHLGGGDVNISYGLPTEEALEVCRRRYRFDVAKLTVEIAEPDVTEIVKDIRVSFADQLGVIGGFLASILIHNPT